MLEVRFHGRGGQGTVLASYILCKAAFLEGQDVQSFTFFGAERRGAPVTAFARLDCRPILVRCQIREPNRVVVLDPVLPLLVDVFAGVKPAALAFFNAEALPEDLLTSIDPGIETICMNATRIALRHRLGMPESPIVNTAVLGGFAGATRIVGLEALAEAVRSIVPQHAERNVEAVREAYACARQGALRHVNA